MGGKEETTIEYEQTKPTEKLKKERKKKKMKRGLCGLLSVCTNDISMAYPAVFSSCQLQMIINILGHGRQARALAECKR